MGSLNIHNDQKIMSIKTEHLNPQDPEFDVMCISYAAEVQIVNWPKCPGYSGMLPQDGLIESERESVEAMMNENLEMASGVLNRQGSFLFSWSRKDYLWTLEKNIRVCQKLWCHTHTKLPMNAKAYFMENKAKKEMQWESCCIESETAN